VGRLRQVDIGVGCQSKRTEIMGAFEDANSLIQHAEIALPNIRKNYEASLHAKQISPTLLIDVKNFCENLRSALDFAASRIFERYGKSPTSAKPKIYFAYATASQNKTESGRIDTCIPGLSKSRPDIVQLVLEMQHFGARGFTWLPSFMELTNENKHQWLTPQVRKETKELRISGGGAQVSVGEGASILVGRGASISIGSAVISGGQSFDVSQPPQVKGGKVEVITWVSFLFESNNQPVMPFLEKVLLGICDICDEPRFGIARRRPDQ
jgi:hypothetical protein